MVPNDHVLATCRSDAPLRRSFQPIRIAAEPHVTDPSWFDRHPVVLHVSLRDLAPEILLTATNIVDAVEHCQKANTSTHLAELSTGNRDFLDGTLNDVIAGRVTVPAGRTVVFSPFGLGCSTSRSANSFTTRSSAPARLKGFLRLGRARA